MKRSYFLSILILCLISNQFSSTFSERRISQEEWQQIRYDALGSDAAQWTFNNGDNNANLQTTVIENSSSSPTMETNIQSVDVGRDKLVLVNDEGSIKMVRASQLPTMSKPNTDVIVTTPAPQPTVLQMPYDQYLATKGLKTYKFIVIF